MESVIPTAHRPMELLGMLVGTLLKHGDSDRKEVFKRAYSKQYLQILIHLLERIYVLANAK